MAFKAHMTGKRTELNGQELAKAGIPVNDGTLRMAFVFGANGAKRIAQADPNTRIEAIDPAAVSANPEFAGLTAGQVMQGMAEQIATGKDPFAHRRADGEWGVDKADEFRRQGESDARGIERDRAEYLAAAEKAPAGSAERMEMLHEAHDASRRATEQYDKLLKSPPVYQPTDAFAGFGGVLMALAAFAGGRSAQPLTGSLTAMSGMLDGMNQGNKEAYERAYHIWDMQTEGALKLVNIQNNEIRNVLEDQRMADNEKAAHLQTIFAANQMHESAAALREGNWMKVWQIHDTTQNLAEKVKEHADTIKEREKDRESREKIAAERAPEEKTFISQGMRAYEEAHPDATTDDKSNEEVRLHKEWTQKGGAGSSKFGSVDDLMNRWHDDFRAKENREPTTDEIAAQRAELVKASKPQAQQLASMTRRLEIGANEVGRAVESMTALPFGTTLGLFGGAQSSVGTGLVENLKKALANEMTPQSAQVLKALTNGVTRGLAILEAGGSAQGLVGLGNQLAGDLPQAGDTGLTIAAKFADVRQIVEAATEVLTAGSDIQPKQQELIAKINDRVKTAIPFTTIDVARMVGDPSDETIHDFAAKAGLGKLPDGVPEGSRLVGKKDGYPVYQDKDGGLHMVQP
jgi:hypothetical protein